MCSACAPNVASVPSEYDRGSYRSSLSLCKGSVRYTVHFKFYIEIIVEQNSERYWQSPWQGHTVRKIVYRITYPKNWCETGRYHNTDMFSTHVLYVSLYDMDLVKYHLVHMFSTHVLYMDLYCENSFKCRWVTPPSKSQSSDISLLTQWSTRFQQYNATVYARFQPTWGCPYHSFGTFSTLMSW